MSVNKTQQNIVLPAVTYETDRPETPDADLAQRIKRSIALSTLDDPAKHHLLSQEEIRRILANRVASGR